jgi:capsular exopolysaccharide synthesis family protein
MTERAIVQAGKDADRERLADDPSWDSTAPAPGFMARAEALPREELVSFNRPRSFEAEQYHTLCQILVARKRASGSVVVAVSSAGIGDGKTLTTTNLAGALAQTPGSRVLLIDGDMRRPAVAAMLGLRGTSRIGLAGAIARDSRPLSSSIQHLPKWNVSVLTAGSVNVSPYELLSSPGFSQLIEEARRQFEFVLIDCPPLLSVPDCRLIERVVDGFLLVVSADSTPRKLLEEGLNTLSEKSVLGLVFNRDSRPLSGYYGYYGRHYGGEAVGINS